MDETLAHVITALGTATIAAIVRIFEKRKMKKKQENICGDKYN